MSFTDQTKANVGFKRAFGKAHTSPRELANESVASNYIIHAKDIFAENIDPSPAQAVTDGVAEFVVFELVLDNTSNGKAYYCKFPSGHATYPDAYVFDTPVHIIPQSFHLDYRAILKDNGTEVPPLAEEDWFLDGFAGIVTSENDLNLGSTGTVDAYIYIGEYVFDQLGATGSFGPTGAQGAAGVTGIAGFASIEEDDVEVVSDAQILNFEGQVSVVDEGSGKATVQIVAQPGDIVLDFGGQDTDSFRSNSPTIFERARSFTFRGTNVQTPVKAIFLLSADTSSDWAQARVYDAENAQIIGTTAATNSTDRIELEVSLLSNLPSAQATFEVQITRVAGSNYVYVHGFTLAF